MANSKMVEKDISEMSHAQVVWLLETLGGHEPTISSRYLSDAHRIVIGVESYVSSDLYSWSSVEHFDDLNMSFNWDDEICVAKTPSGFVGRDFDMLFAGHRAVLFEKLTPAMTHSVPDCLKDR